MGGGGGGGVVPVAVDLVVGPLDEVFVKLNQAAGEEGEDEGQNHFLKKGPVHG